MYCFLGSGQILFSCLADLDQQAELPMARWNVIRSKGAPNESMISTHVRPSEQEQSVVRVNVLMQFGQGFYKYNIVREGNCLDGDRKHLQIM